MKRSIAVLAMLGVFVCMDGARAQHHARAAEYGDSDDDEYGADDDDYDDHDADRKTPNRRAAAQVDRDLTMTIRRSLADDQSLSTNARNVKVNIKNGVVTLHGPVKSEEEKAAVLTKAQHTTGVRRVDDRLEIKSEE